ncbi:hypothetical protein MHYP_G00058060 [Metynnis hypsauchen]
MPGRLQLGQVERELCRVFCELTVLLSSSVCSEHTAARLGSGAGSDAPAKSLCFQPLMFQHCYEAERLTAPVL